MYGQPAAWGEPGDDDLFIGDSLPGRWDAAASADRRLRGAVGNGLECAEGVVDGFGVGEGVEEVGGDEHEVRALLHAGVVLAADGFAEVEALFGFLSLLHIVVSRLQLPDVR